MRLSMLGAPHSSSTRRSIAGCSSLRCAITAAGARPAVRDAAEGCTSWSTWPTVSRSGAPTAERRSASATCWDEHAMTPADVTVEHHDGELVVIAVHGDIDLDNTRVLGEEILRALPSTA